MKPDITRVVLTIILYGVLPLVEVGLLLRGLGALWKRLGISDSEPKLRRWRGLLWIGGAVGGLYLWRAMAQLLSPNPLVDYLGKLVSLGLGVVLPVVLFDGWRFLRKLRR